LNAREGRVELGAQSLHGSNDRNRNASGDESIFNGGRAVLVPQKLEDVGHD